MHVSRNRLEGSIAEVPLSALLDSCRRVLFTGTIKISGGKPGTLVLRAGFVDDAQFDGKRGEDAVKSMMELRDGMYEVQQRLPDLSGILGRAAQLEGEISDVPIPTIMRHIEDNALSCTLIVIGGFDRGEVMYRAGEIKEITLNGKRDDEAIVQIVAFKDAKFRVAAMPLDPMIAGWPKVDREPTAPFKLMERDELATVGTAPAVPTKPDPAPTPTAAPTAPTPTPTPSPAPTPTPSPTPPPAPAPAHPPVAAAAPPMSTATIAILVLVAIGALVGLYLALSQ